MACLRASTASDLSTKAACADNIARASQLLAKPQDQTASADATDVDEPPINRCPRCGGRMIIIERFKRGATPRHQPTAPTVSIKLTPHERLNAARRRIRLLAVLVVGPDNARPQAQTIKPNLQKIGQPTSRSHSRDRQSRSALPSTAARTPYHLTGGAQIPIAQPYRSVLLPRFPPWKFSNASRQHKSHVVSCGRHPKTFPVGDIVSRFANSRVTISVKNSSFQPLNRTGNPTDRKAGLHAASCILRTSSSP